MSSVQGPVTIIALLGPAVATAALMLEKAFGSAPVQSTTWARLAAGNTITMARASIHFIPRTKFFLKVSMIDLLF
jgi:hypothetical protein